MSQEIETCPKCEKGKLRPTGKSGITGEETQPFRETAYIEEYN